jgi:hypothetical protein
LLCPVEDGDLTARLERILAADPGGTSVAWTLGADGSWTRVIT